MTASVDELLRRLGQGEDPERMLTLLLNERDAELVKIASVPRWLNVGVLRALLNGDRQAAEDAFERIQTLRLTEPVPGSPDAVRLRRAVRDESLQRWWHEGSGDGVVPRRLADLSARMASHFEAAGDELEAVYHMFAADPGVAARTFRELYDAADMSFDLARCGDLLAVLEQVVGHVPVEVAREVAGYSARFAARSLWIDDWYRSSRFLAPERGPDGKPRSCDLFERLLDGGLQTLEVRARGGMGKTMHLRWLIARRCVPDGIACARIDFDDADVAAAIESPWLILLALAAQLNPQMPARPFERLVAQYGDQLPRLYPTNGEEAPLPISVAQDAAIGEAVRRSFNSGVAAIPASQRWVVILDTLEVPLLRVPDDGQGPLEFIAQLRRLSQAPSARIVFAGRQALSEKFASFGELFPRADILDLHGFTLRDRERYLVAKRGITTPDIIEAASKVAGAVPFKLALVADVLDRRPEMPADVLRAYGEPDLLYLIDRVLERIEAGPRWILRYGVVPRILDYAFVRDVMEPYLRRAMAGDHSRDQVSEDRLPDGRPAATVWPTNLVSEDRELDLQSLWAELKRHAGDSSWVTIPQGRTDTVLLHSDVVTPMRRLLAEKEELFQDLQRDAQRYFEAREQSDPDNAARWAREAVFHRFQLEGRRAAEYWRERLRAGSGPDWAEFRLMLAVDLSGQDYVDEHGPLKWIDGEPLIDPATLAEARFEEAWANIQLARAAGVPRTATQWRTARLALEAAERASFEDPRGARWTEGRLAMAWTAIHFVEGNDDLARKRFNQVRRGKVDREDQLWLWIEYGPALANSFIRRTVQSATTARAVRRSGRSDYWRRRISDAEGTREANEDRLAEALEHYTEALHTAEAQDREAAAGAVASLLLRTGENADALKLLDDDRTASNRLLRARALVRRQEARQALATLRAGTVDIAAAVGAGALEAMELDAEAAELSGHASALLLDIESTLRAYVRAADLWSRAGSPEGCARAHAHRASFLLHSVGDVLDAQIAVTAAQKAGARPGGSSWARVQLIRAHVEARSLDVEAATSTVRATIAALKREDAPPRRLVATALTGLAVSVVDDHPELAELLADQLEKVTPESARLVMIAPMRYVDTLPPLKRRTLSRLQRLAAVVSGSVPGQLDPRDEALLAVAGAEADRVLRDPASAADKLRHARPALAVEAGGERLRGWLEAVARLGGGPDLLGGVRAVGLARLRRSDPGEPAAAGLAAALCLAAEAPLDAELQAAAETVAQETASGRRDTRWRADLERALQRSAAARGDQVEAAVHARNAATIYERLGDRLSRLRLLHREHDSVQLATRPDDGAIDITIGVEGDAFAVEVSVRPGEVDRMTVSVPRLAGILTGAGKAGWGEAYARDLVAEMVDHHENLTAAFSEVLEAPVVEKALALQDGRDIRLRLRDHALETAPWEIAGFGQGKPLIARPSVRWFHRAETQPRADVLEIRSVQLGLRSSGWAVSEDGTLGPETRVALKEFQRAEDLAPTGVPDPRTVQRLHRRLCPNRTVTVVRVSGFGPQAEYGSVGSTVERIYASCGFHVETLSGFDVNVDSLHRRPSAILHFSLPFWETGGSVGLDVAQQGYAKAGYGYGYAESLTAAALDHAMHGPLPGPVVILDPPLPSSTSDAVVQLLLRNAFAGELFALGNARAVLGTGLAALENEERLYRRLIEALASGDTFGEAITRVRRTGLVAATLHARSAELRTPWQ